MSQLDLFSRTLEAGHGYANRKAPWTSQVARRDAITTEKQYRYPSVLLEAEERGEVGATDHSAAARTQLPLSSINSLRNSLGDFVVNSGTWAQSPYGKPATVYRITDAGKAALSSYSKKSA